MFKKITKLPLTQSIKHCSILIEVSWWTSLSYLDQLPRGLIDSKGFRSINQDLLKCSQVGMMSYLNQSNKELNRSNNVKIDTSALFLYPIINLNCLIKVNMCLEPLGYFFTLLIIVWKVIIHFCLTYDSEQGEQ